MPDSRHIAIIGAGWSGMAAAVTLAEQGVRVTVFEAARELGGRARRLRLDGMDLDNGQHILIGAYHWTLAMMRKVGADPERLLQRLPLAMQFADGFRLRAPRLPSPLHLAVALFGAQGLNLAQAWQAARFMQALQQLNFAIAPDRSVAQLMRDHAQDGAILTHLWEPLCVAALNTPIGHASAQVFANVLRDSLTGSRANSDLLLPRVDLGRLFPDVAAGYLSTRNGVLETGAAVRRIEKRGAVFRIDSRATEFSGVVLATAPQHAAALLPEAPELDATSQCINALQYEPIVTCYLKYPDAARLPASMMGFCGGMLQWAFDRGQLGGPAGLIACVISASGEHDALDNEALTHRVHLELSGQLQLDAAPSWSRVITERRATFSCTPALRRPAAATPIPGLVLAGDYVASDYPGTLESAVRSGVFAARLLLD